MPHDAAGRLNLCIALPTHPPHLYQEMEEMLYDILDDSPFVVTILHDGDTRALDADALLFVGDCQHFQILPPMLKDCPRRPITMLWLLDSLPPMGLTSRALRIGSRLALYNKSVTLARTRHRSLISMIPLPIRQRLGSAMCFLLLAGLNAEVARCSQHQLGTLDVNSQYEVMGRQDWIRTSISEGWLDHIFVGTLPRKAFLAELGIPSTQVPFGYHPGLGRDMGLVRDIDVLFIGDLTYGRRIGVLQVLRRGLEKRGLSLTVVDSNCYGEERIRLLSRAKISLCIPRFSWDMPDIRLPLIMSCGAMVAAEPMGDTAPFVPGAHFAQAEADELADVMTYYVRHDEEREGIVRSANELLSTCTLERSITQVLGVVTEPAMLQC